MTAASAAYRVSQTITETYSTSFSLASRLFGADIRPHIYAIYGLVRIADEIVDDPTVPDPVGQLQAYEDQVYAAMDSGFSTDPIIQAFVATARTFAITTDMLAPFFSSMRTDLNPPTSFTTQQYAAYIYGSAEVIGLMCLKVFSSSAGQYSQLENGARHLGAAFQKVNFLRDLAADHDELHRYYFPVASFETFDEDTKQQIIQDVAADFEVARAAVRQLPRSSRYAVGLAYRYYESLLRRLERTPADQIRRKRIRLNDWAKMAQLLDICTRKVLGIAAV